MNEENMTGELELIKKNVSDILLDYKNLVKQIDETLLINDENIYKQELNQNIKDLEIICKK